MANNHHNRITILIVDDHEVVRNGIRSYLETVKEFQVIGEAASGEEAVKLVSEHIPDIVLLDLIMPGMDGFQVIHELERNERWKGIPVVVMSGKELSESEQKQLEAHVADFLVKDSFSTTAFSKTIKQILSDAQS